MSRLRLEASLKSLKSRREATWQQAQVYLENRDSHGIMDMGAEIQALDRAVKEIESLMAVNSETRPRRWLDWLVSWITVE